MQRRDFFKTTGLAAIASSLAFPAYTMEIPNTAVHKLHKPARLREGATIGLIAPSSPIPTERLSKTLTTLTGLGFRIKEGKNLRLQNGYLAGADAQRLADLHQAFADPEVEAVWCVRGGYGATRLLAEIDYELIGSHPKPFVGYSDITALHLAIHQQTGLVTFHGPVGASDFPENTLQHFRSVLMEPIAGYVLALPGEDEELPRAEYRPFVLAPGSASGMLTGGNLALLAALAGTRWSPSFHGKIVFIEDIGEQPYRIDRMLTQLLQATDFDKAAGIALGVFSDCQPKGDAPSLSLVETLQDRLDNLGIPVAYGFPFGHVAHQGTLPYGIRAEIDTARGTLTLLETAVL